MIICSIYSNNELIGKPLEYLLIKEKTTIGRRDCDIIIDNPRISALHCTVIKTGKLVTIVDGDGVKRSSWGLRIGNSDEKFKSICLFDKTVVKILEHDPWLIELQYRDPQLIADVNRDETFAGFELSEREKYLVEIIQSLTERIESASANNLEATANNSEAVNHLIEAVKALDDRVDKSENAAAAAEVVRKQDYLKREKKREFSARLVIVCLAGLIIMTAIIGIVATVYLRTENPDKAFEVLQWIVQVVGGAIVFTSPLIVKFVKPKN